MTRFLKKEGFQPRIAADGQEGILLARKLRPDVIILDVMLPRVDGWAVLQTLKKDPELASIPVIMLTIVDEKNLAFMLGAAEYMTKPVNRHRMAAILNKLHPSRRDGHVLIVEDDAATRQRLQDMLEQQGWLVAQAENGRVGLERLQQRRPDLILLDLQMPEMDGFQLASELHHNSDWRTIPIVVLTAQDLTPEDPLRLNGYVQKIFRKGPSLHEELLRELRDLLATCTRQKPIPLAPTAS